MSLGLILLLGVAASLAVYVALRIALWTLVWARKSRRDGLELSWQMWLGDALDGASARPWGHSGTGSGGLYPDDGGAAPGDHFGACDSGHGFHSGGHHGGAGDHCGGGHGGDGGGVCGG